MDPSKPKVKNPKLALIKPLAGSQMQSVKQRFTADDEINAIIDNLQDLPRLKFEPSFVLYMCNLVQNLDSVVPPMSGAEKREFVVGKIAGIFGDWDREQIGKIIDFVCAAGLVYKVSTGAVTARSLLKKLASIV